MAFMSRATHVLQWLVQTVANPRGELIRKSRPQFGLESATHSMKLESLVIADQNAAVNTFPGLVHTARHITKVDCTRSRCANSQERQPSKVWFMIGVKS